MTLRAAATSSPGVGDGEQECGEQGDGAHQVAPWTLLVRFTLRHGFSPEHLN
jgi:hypothetical protein